MVLIYLSELLANNQKAGSLNYLKPFSNVGKIGVELTQLGQWVSRVNMDIVDMAFIKVDKEESFQLSNYTKRAKINDEQLQLLLMDRCLNITRINLTSRDSGILTNKSSVKHGPKSRLRKHLKSTFMAGVANIAAVSLAIGYPTAASLAPSPTA